MQNTAKKIEPTALIQPTPPKDAADKVAGILGNIEKHVGFVPDGLRLYGISPPLLETFVGNIGYFSMGGTPLRPELMAMIRYQVSWETGCSFCVDMNEGFLMNMGLTLDQIRATRNNPDAAPFPQKEKELLKLAVNAVEAPESVTAAHIDNMHKLGWSDREIFDAVAQAANNRAFNIVLRTFKIEHQGSLA